MSSNQMKAALACVLSFIVGLLVASSGGKKPSIDQTIMPQSSPAVKPSSPIETHDLILPVTPYDITKVA
jgi:hypothetical protein|tara:strand:- start:344 stop:550 length:207 start_codon:yes stop_codon:yes gene_type:complete